LLPCCFVGSVLVCFLLSSLLIRSPLFTDFSPSFVQLGSNSFPSIRFSSAAVSMDHVQGRAFHHHLARAIMRLNYLAGLLPFFEPSIEWDDPIPDHHLRSGRSNPASRSLHTFVPLPASSNPPTLVSHGGIPSHMVLNPEPNLRPLTIASHPREEEGQNPNLDVTTRNPVATAVQATIISARRPTAQEETEINFWPSLHVSSSISAYHFRDPTNGLQFG
jgi:hypothetical protein